MNHVMPLEALPDGAMAALLARYGLELQFIERSLPIPGSYWGEREAGLIGDQLFARYDTPVHSILHEGCHYVCMSPERRRPLHTDAGGNDLEENSVCYLQIVLADELAGFGRDRMLADMDTWGYSFRLGSARAWFEKDADDAREWLIRERLITPSGKPTWEKRS